MTPETLPQWLLPLWRDLLERKSRLPHALLLIGPNGSGKRLFAEHLARALLCANPRADGFACGECADCTWLASGNHPDILHLVPASDAVNDEEVAGGEEGSMVEPARKEKAKSSQILIDQVRELQSSIEIGAGGHAGGRRVIIVDPAEAMNVAAANALLKSLEEPPGSTVFVLLSRAPRRLLPTIRSRCQVLTMPLPDRVVAASWLQAAGGGKNEALIGFCGGLPIAARDLANGPLADARAQLAKDLVNLRTVDPLKLAAEWDARIKAKGAQEAGLDMPLLIDWMQRWVSDGARAAGDGAARFYADYDVDLRRLALGRAEVWLSCYNELGAHRRVASHPLNARLFLEEIWLTVRRRIAAPAQE